jgi:2-oxoisovalerate dehydrogenase E1 component
MRETGGPVLLQADVYRYFHQSGAYLSCAFGHRSKEEERAWKLRDPVDFMQKELL